MAKRRLCESPTDLGRCGGSADSRAELREPQPQVGQCAPWRQQRHEPATIGGRRASQTLPAYCDDGEPRSFSGTTRDSPTVTLVHPVAQRDTKHEFGEGYLRAIERAVDAEERPSKRQRTGEAQEETIFDRAGSPFSPNHFAPRKGTPLLFQSLACAPCPVLTRPFGPPPVPPATSSQKASDGSHYPSAPLDNTEAEVGVSEPIRHPPASDNQIHEPANSPGFFFCAAPERLEEHSTEVLGSSHAMQATQALLKTRAALQAIEDHPDARTIIFQRAGWGPHDMLGHILRIADKSPMTADAFFDSRRYPYFKYESRYHLDSKTIADSICLPFGVRRVAGTVIFRIASTESLPSVKIVYGTYTAKSTDPPITIWQERIELVYPDGLERPHHLIRYDVDSLAPALAISQTEGKPNDAEGGGRTLLASPFRGFMGRLETRRPWTRRKDLSLALKMMEYAHMDNEACSVSYKPVKTVTKGTIPAWATQYTAEI